MIDMKPRFNIGDTVLCIALNVYKTEYQSFGFGEYYIEEGVVTSSTCCLTDDGISSEFHASSPHGSGWNRYRNNRAEDINNIYTTRAKAQILCDKWNEISAAKYELLQDYQKKDIINYDNKPKVEI